MEKDFGKATDAVIELLRTDRYLLGASFAGVVTGYVTRLRMDVEQALSDNPPSAEAHAQWRREHFLLREAFITSFPPFARIPEDDLHFSSPDPDLAFIEILESATQREKK